MKTLTNVTVLPESKKFEVLIEKFKGYVVWHDNLFGVSNAHYVGRYKPFILNIVLSLLTCAPSFEETSNKLRILLEVISTFTTATI